MKIVLFKKRKKKKRSARWKIPHWTSVHIARSDENYHRCDECDGPILKGFQYEREVYGCWHGKSKKTITYRKHISPPCEMFVPPDDSDEINRSNEESLKNAV